MRYRPEQDGYTTTDSSAKMLLIVESDITFGSFLVRILLEETPYHCVLATDEVQAQSYLEEVIPDLLLFHYHISGSESIELYDRFYEFQHVRDVPTIIVSNDLPVEEVQKRHVIGIKRPLELTGLLEVIGEHLQTAPSYRHSAA